MIKHLNGTESLSQRAADVVACMQVNQDAREAYWGAYPSLEIASEYSVFGAEGTSIRD
jgi:hypothetical protein